jgi:hypothetical protein
MQEGASRDGIGVGPSFALHHSQAKAKRSYIFAEWTKNQALKLLDIKAICSSNFHRQGAKIATRSHPMFVATETTTSQCPS